MNYTLQIRVSLKLGWRCVEPALLQTRREEKSICHSNDSYCNGFDQRVARQQLCKHSQHATVEEAVFSVSAVMSQNSR
jgi:hypothetical protein